MTTPTARRRPRLGPPSGVVAPTEPGRVVPRPAMSPSWRRLGVVGVGLFVFYVVLSLALSPHGHLITDVGGKTATLAGMAERGDWSTDLGYWAESSDPDGEVFPYAHTWKADNGWWVNTTSLPMILLSRPIWMLGGAPLILLVPMLSAVAAALVAGRTQAYLDHTDGVTAAIAVGVASPLVIYALEFWEHAPGLALMGVGSLAALKAADGRGSRHGVVAGLSFGLAATMRQEALVYGFATGLVLVASLFGAWRLRTDRTLRSVGAGLAPAVAMGAAAAATLAGSTLFESWYYGGALRSGRSADAVSAAAGLDGLGERLEAAMLTTLSPMNSASPLVFAIAAMMLGAFVWLGFAADRNLDLRPPAVVLLLVALFFGLRFVQLGPDFVPGLVPTTSLAVVGAVFALRRAELRRVAWLALVPVPIVLLSQYVGGAGVQWGGRYLLLTGYLLTIAACVALGAAHRRLLHVLLAAGLIITGSGVWLASQRTRAVAADMDRVTAFADGEVVVWFDPVVAREAGPAIIDQRWLTTWADGKTDEVVVVLDRERIDRFVYVGYDARDLPEFEGFGVETGSEPQQLDFFGQRLTVFERLDS